MSKWKCEICNSSFENFDARGFDNKIYCPLCYYKKLYKDTELERERLNNIINGVEDLLKRFKGSYREIPIQIVLNEIRELKGEPRDIEVCGSLFTRSEYNRLAGIEEDKKIEKLSFGDISGNPKRATENDIIDKINEIIDKINEE